VLGRPIAHSLSPVLHRAAYTALGLDWTYESLDCGVEELAAVLAARADWAGFSCTMPLKQAALAAADEIGPTARAVGAANTLLPLAGDRWRADNTDVHGIAAALAESGATYRTATVIGAGGTAQAAVVALARAGVDACTALVRDPARTAQLRAGAQRVSMALSVAPLEVTAPALQADLVVCTLPPGAADPLAVVPWRTGQCLLDVVYAPWPTALAAAAAAAGATVVGGDAMLLHQAAAQVTLMTAQPAPVAAMRTALQAALRGPS
jgi:shikimate dehydrogenase